MVTIGADPELFLVDDLTGGIIPACGLIGGTKDKPHELGGGFAVQEDNVMVEYNIPPATDPNTFSRYVTEGLNSTMNFVRTKLDTASYSSVAEHLFGYNQLTADGALVFGCSPDFNAYARGEAFDALHANVLERARGAWRFAGGHVHIGYGNPSEVPEYVVAGLADLFIGLRSVGADQQKERRKLYGQPGRYRPTKYGIEYRTLSNYWIFDPDTAYGVGIAANQLGHYVESTPKAEIQRLFKETPWNDVRRAISEDDQALARSLISYVRGELNVGI
jgi:hypothetical protein